MALRFLPGVSVLISAVIFAAPARSEIALHPLFSDHMVLQRERLLPVWGTGAPGEKVVVTFNGESRAAVTNAQGKWMVQLSPQRLSTAPLVLTARGTNEVKVSDILVGDVWLGTGQSNMDYTVNGTDGVDRVKAAAPDAYKGIRLFKAPVSTMDDPQGTFSESAAWEEPTVDNIMGFSAVLFYFGEELHKRIPGVPLGLIRSSRGATNAYCWLPNEIRDKDAGAAYVREWWAGVMKGWNPRKQAEVDQASKDYEAKVADLKARTQPIPKELKKPGEVIGPKWSCRPSGLYNGMIAPLQPFAVIGMIWYQGEWDAKQDWVKVYHDTFLGLAKGWRANWARAANNPKAGDFPIFIVQLPSRTPDDGEFWPFMREVQARLALDVPRSGFVPTLDLNDGTNLHPPEKTEIGKRLARLALAKEYGQKVAYQGPVPKSSHPMGSQFFIEFDPGAGTLVSKDGQPLRNFELAGSDGKYFPATARVQGNVVALAAPQVPRPTTVRYAFQPAPSSMNLYNSEGLPAAPFRTDTQPVR